MHLNKSVEAQNLFHLNILNEPLQGYSLIHKTGSPVTNTLAFLSDVEKIKFYNFDIRDQCYKTFLSVIKELCNELECLSLARFPA